MNNGLQGPICQKTGNTQASESALFQCYVWPITSFPTNVRVGPLVRQFCFVPMIWKSGDEIIRLPNKSAEQEVIFLGDHLFSRSSFPT